MEDLAQQINEILSDPNQMQQLQNMMNSLGLGASAQASSPPAPEPPPPTPPQPNPLAGLSGLGDNAQMLGMVTKLAPLLGQLGREDDSTRLLRALRPLLGAERQKKLDEAVKILQMMRLLPLLKESGIFSGLLSGLL